ncbi:MAG: hypothetical protein NT126_05740 [Bacteroidetes bacterium]|nr:hypothetical protein [Bacteroidota bacterium]
MVVYFESPDERRNTFYILFNLVFFHHVRCLRSNPQHRQNRYQRLKTDTSDYVHHPVFSLNIGSGLEIDRQKITVYDASNSLDASLQKFRELFIFSSGFRFTYNGPSDILNTGFFHLRFRYDYKNTLHPETFLQYQWDSRRGIVQRKLAGANLRWNNYLHPKLNLILASGFMVEAEQWNYIAVDSEKIPVNAPDIKNLFLKSNNYVKLEYKVSDHSDLFFTTFVQFRPNAFYRYPRIANSVKWNVDVTRHLSISFDYSSVYDTKPVVPIDRFYYSISNSLVYKL